MLETILISLILKGISNTIIANTILVEFVTHSILVHFT